MRDGSGEERLVRPDIIVHRRGGNSDNLLVIEAKRRDNPTDRELDYQKLRAFTQHLGRYHYCYGLFIDMPVREAYMDAPILRWFVNGELV